MKTILLVLTLTTLVFSQTQNRWEDVRDYLCYRGEALNYPNSMCQPNCQYCVDNSFNTAWCQQGTVTIKPNAGITKYNITGMWKNVAFCWPSSPTSLSETKITVNVTNNNNPLPADIEVSCQDPIGIPQWAQCDVNGSYLLIGPIFVILLIIALIVVIVVVCCDCCKKNGEDSKATTAPPPSQPKEAHPIFDQWSKVDVNIETKSNDDTSIEMEDKPSVTHQTKPVDSSYKPPEKKTPQPQAQVQPQYQQQQNEEPDYFSTQEKAKPFRPQTLTIDVNALDDFFEDDD